jgi:hypothetical protein
METNSFDISPRFNHAFCVFSNIMWIHGGQCLSGKTFQDYHFYNLKTRKWFQKGITDFKL